MIQALESISDNNVQELKMIEGEVRGVVFATDAEYILYEKGEEGLTLLEKKLAEIGNPLKYKEIKTMAYYPVWWRVLSLLAIKEVFGYSDEDIKKMGASSPKISFMIRLFMKHFVSIAKTLEQMPKMWTKHYTVGDFSVKALDEQKKELVLKLENFNIHPIICIYLAGYISKIMEMVVRCPVACQETECSFLGSDHHEFLLKW